MPGEKQHLHYDVAIIGGGPAGLTAAIYAGRARLKAILFEKALVGGLATYTNEIVNYPGFPQGLTGLDLMHLFEAQARAFGAEIKNTPVKAVDLTGEDKTIETFRTVYHAKAVIIATGGKPRLLGVPGEADFLYDKGISFCATCDAAQCLDKTVVVIGSGDAAVEEALFLTKFARKVIMSVLHEEGHMDANAVAREEALKNPKMEFRWNTVVDHFEGDGRLERVVLRNTRANALEPVEADRCFYFIGYVPATDLFRGQITLTDRGYIPTDVHMQTNVDGVYAAGDVRQTCLRQVATAVGDGATAGYEAERYIAEIETFQTQLMQKDKPGLIYVYSAIDESSRALLPLIGEIEQLYEGRVKVSQVDTYKSVCLAARLGGVQPPCLVYTRDGQVTDRSTRFDRADIVKALDELLEQRVPVPAE